MMRVAVGCRYVVFPAFGAALWLLGGHQRAESAEAISSTDGVSGSPVYVDRSAAVDLARAESSFRTGDLVGGVTHLRRLLDRPIDSFVPGNGQLDGMRAAAEALLRQQPPGTRQFYESAETASASAALAVPDGAEVSTLRTVVRRFPGTEPGFHAANRLATIAFDRGDFRAAVRQWEALLEDPRHTQRVRPATIARLLTALRRSGRDGRASELAIRYSGMSLRLGGEPASVSQLLSRIRPAVAAIPTTAEADTSREGLSPPAFPPDWTVGDGVGSEPLRELWVGSRRAEGRPVGVPAGAVVTSSGFVVREAAAVVAYDAESGTTLWRMPMSPECGSQASSPGDLNDLTRLETGYASGGVYGRLTADGERVYVLDSAAETTPSPVRTASPVGDVAVPVGVTEQQPGGIRTNRLLALPASPSEDADQRPLWVVGGRMGGDTHLAGHYFFGPPTVTDDGLFALAEHRQCLYLVALEPGTGEVFWRQPLGYVPRPVSSDGERGAAYCVPTVAEGVAVCGTNAGFVVAFDASAGRLLWAYDYASGEPEAGRRDGGSDRIEYHGDPAFPCPAVARRDRVVFMPGDSRFVHCVDLRTGAILWKSPREDGLYVACLDDRSALIVGRSRCRALSVAGGSPVWTARFGTPAGTGVATDTAYLLPLEDGRIVGIDLARGRATGFDAPRSADGFHPLSDQADVAYGDRWRPGNLFADGENLISVGPAGVAKLRTASHRLGATPEALTPLDRARVELAAGRLVQAATRLETLIAADADVEAAESAQARTLLRELHYLRLDTEVGGVGDPIAELDRLSRTPEDRGRFLLRAAERDLGAEDLLSLRSRTDELACLDLPGPIASPVDSTLLVTPASWVPSLLRRGRTDDRRTEEMPSSLVSCPTPELERRLPFLGDGPGAHEVRRELAGRAVADGEWQRAELLLLRNLESGSSVASRRDLEDLRRLAGLPVGESPQHAVARPVGDVRVTGQLWAPADEGVRRAFGGMRRDFPTRGRDLLRVVDRGDSRQSRLAVVDLESGVCLGEISVDSRLRWPLAHRQSTQGHLVPVASVGRLHGLSLLEIHRGEPVWTADLPVADGMLPQVGPYGPSFCTIQTRRELTALDPISGEILWQRTELPPERGLHGDQAAGLFGDSEALTMLDSDGSSYATYRTRTGEELGVGRLPIDRQRQRRAYGRKLFFVETGDGTSTARLWDPLTNSYDLAIDFEGRLLQTSTREDELVLLFADGRLLIYDTVASSAAVDVRLRLPEGPGGADPHAVWIFSDADRYYVSLYRSDPARFEEPKVTSFIYGMPLSAAHVQGRLLAIDRSSGAILWDRATDQRSVIDPVDHPAPFLVATARVSDRRFGNRKTLLVEAIDKRTGATLGRNDSLVADQPLQIRSRAGRVELAGMTSTVVLKFDSEPLDDAVAARPLEAAPVSNPTAAGRVPSDETAAALDSPDLRH